MPPRQSTLIRAAALYSRHDIPWGDLPDGTHQISVAGRPDGDHAYYYSLTRKFESPEEPARLAGMFALRPAGDAQGGRLSSVVGALGGELVLDTYGGGGAVDSAAAAMREVRGDLRTPWDTAPGTFNHHDEAALARFRRDMPALAASLEHYLKFSNVLDEFDGGGDPIVLFNLDADVREDALKPLPNLYKFYRRLAQAVTAESAILDQRGNFWMRSSFDRGHIRTSFMLRRGMLTPFDARFAPAGEPVALATLRRGSYRTESSVHVRSLGMTFGLDRLLLSSDYTRDEDSVLLTSRMNQVPGLVAPPIVHGVIELIAGEFLRVLARGHGGLAASFTSKRQGDGTFRLTAGITAEFDYSPTLGLLARVGDAIADAHNDQVRAEERKLGEELFNAFVTDYNHARPKILALDNDHSSPR